MCVIFIRSMCGCKNHQTKPNQTLGQGNAIIAHSPPGLRGDKNNQTKKGNNTCIWRRKKNQTNTQEGKRRKKKRSSDTGTRTQVARVRAENDNHLHHIGVEQNHGQLLKILCPCRCTQPELPTPCLRPTGTCAHVAYMRIKTDLLLGALPSVDCC